MPLTVSITECPACHYRFNYEFIPGASFHSIRLGAWRIFKCPRCHEMHRFRISSFGSNPGLPTHGDNAETGVGKKVWAMLLFPLVPIFFGAFLPVFGGTGALSYYYFPIVLGLVWVGAYIAYLVVVVK